MTQFDSSGHSASSGASIDFVSRPPSQSWETVPFPDSSQHFFWVWYKPQNNPQGFSIRIPDDVFHTYPTVQQLSMRKLLSLIGIDPALVVVWYQYGTPIDGMGGTSPYWDQPIYAPPPGTDPTIVVQSNVAVQVSHPQTQPPVLEGRNASEIFDHIENEWNTCIIIDKQLTSLRKKLSGLMGRLDSLNRDLNPDERLYADNQDKSDWQDARRWLRDVSGQASRVLKAYDIGEISNAGQRIGLTKMFKQFVEPRQPFDGLEQTERDFVAYRKLVQMLQINMNSALSNAVQNGERRAQQLLSRIASKIRSSRTKRS